MIYFIQDTATCNIKIGVTSGAAEDRLKSLQTGCPGKLVLLWTVDGDEQREAAFHTRFAADNVRGEWFKPSPELLGYLLMIARQVGYFDGHIKGWNEGWEAGSEYREEPEPWDQPETTDCVVLEAALPVFDGFRAFTFTVGEWGRQHSIPRRTHAFCYSLTTQKSVSSVCGLLMDVFGFDADRWGSQYQRPLSAELPRAVSQMPGKRFQAFWDEDGSFSFLRASSRLEAPQ